MSILESTIQNAQMHALQLRLKHYYMRLACVYAKKIPMSPYVDIHLNMSKVKGHSDGVSHRKYYDQIFFDVQVFTCFANMHIM